MNLSGQQIKLIDLPDPISNAHFFADWSLYRQTLFHLIVNALKFSKPKIQKDRAASTVTIYIQVLNSKDALTDKYNLTLETKVLDNGIGITDK